MNQTALLPCVEVETGAQPQAAIIWLHGLGADGHDFEPIVPELKLQQAVRFVFPHAPVRPVTLNGGWPMRAWFDIIALDREAQRDLHGTEESRRAVEALIRRENERGIPTERIVLAGFSQGGALALHTGLRYPEKLAGIIGLSTFLHTFDSLQTEAAPANRATPIFMAHGSEDSVVMPARGMETYDRLQAFGYVIDWHEYPMAHAVCPEEIGDLAQWLQKRLPDAE